MSDTILIVPPNRSLDRRLPLGIMQISSYLGHKGFDNTILDFKNVSEEDAAKKIREGIIKNNPRFVGISCFITEMPIIKDLCDFIKQNNKNTCIIIGGPYPSERPSHFIEMGIPFDYLTIGEAEITFYELLKTLQENADVGAVAGLAYKDEVGDLVFTQKREDLQNLDELPFPAYDKVDMEFYLKPSSWTIRGVYVSGVLMFTSRGCPFSCKFCVVRERKPRLLSPEKVADHIEYLVKNYKIDGIHFGDDTFTLNKERVRTIFSLLKQKGIKLIYGIQTRADLLDEELIKILRDSGVIQINMGIESGSERVLTIINKKIKLEKIRETSKLCKKYNIRIAAYMLINIPGETFEDIEASLRLVNDMKYNVVQWSVYSPYPGVAFGVELDLDDMNTISRFPSKEAFDILERKYKFGKYDKTIKEVLDYIYSKTFNVRNFKLLLTREYIISFFRFISFLSNKHYLLVMLLSKRKTNYAKDFLTQFNAL